MVETTDAALHQSPLVGVVVGPTGVVRGPGYIIGWQPFFNYSLTLTKMHPQGDTCEPTHFCQTPLMWQHIWSNITLALLTESNNTTTTQQSAQPRSWLPAIGSTRVDPMAACRSSPREREGLVRGREKAAKLAYHEQLAIDKPLAHMKGFLRGPGRQYGAHNAKKPTGVTSQSAASAVKHESLPACEAACAPRLRCWGCTPHYNKWVEVDDGCGDCDPHEPGDQFCRWAGASAVSEKRAGLVDTTHSSGDRGPGWTWVPGAGGLPI